MATKEEQLAIVKKFCDHIKSLPYMALGKRQEVSFKERPARGPVWISKTKFDAPPEDSLRDALYEVINHLKEPYHIINPPEELKAADVPVEFLGSREGVAKDAPLPNIPEIEKLKALEKECQNDTTILYVHGGANIEGSPQEYRALTAKLAMRTKSRILSTSYRLSPQVAFPTPILDVLVSYASLLYPPPGSTHSAVDPSKLVFAGDSAGAALLFALTKFLLTYHKLHPGSDRTPTLAFHGRKIALPLPLGIAITSGWGDLTDAMPSWHKQSVYDFLTVVQPSMMPSFPADEIWPSNPPREHPYCRAVTLDHEMVSPAAVKDWTGCPPVWFAVAGEGGGCDGNRVTASQMAKSGVRVTWNEYEGMPHEFIMVMSKLPQSPHALDKWAEAIRGFVRSRGKGVERNSATRVLMPDCRGMDLGSVEGITPLPHAEVRRKMREYTATKPVWTGKLNVPRL